MTSQGQRFRRRALRRGYKVDEVDTFLDRVEATLNGERISSPVSAQEVHDVVFRVRFGGYDEWQVDLHLDRVERQLSEAAERGMLAGGRGEARPPAADRFGRDDFARDDFARDDFGRDDFVRGDRMGMADRSGALPPMRDERMPPPMRDDRGMPPMRDDRGMPMRDERGMPGPPPHDERMPIREERGMPPMRDDRMAPPPPGPPRPAGAPAGAGYGRFDEPAGAGRYPEPGGGRYEEPRFDEPTGAGRFEPFEPGRHGRADMTTEIRMPVESRPQLSGDAGRVDQLRRTFQPRRFGSGYDPVQVDRLFEAIVITMSGRGGGQISDADLDPGQFGLVPGGYFEAEVDQALREVRDILRHRR